MKVKVGQHTITVLNNLKGLWMLRNNDIMIIKDFKYEVEKPQEPLPEINTVVRKKKKFLKPDMSEKIYVTELILEGYHIDLKFIGTYNEDYCTRLLQSHDDEYYTFNFIDCRKAWLRMKEQIDAFTEQEKNLNVTETKDSE